MLNWWLSSSQGLFSIKTWGSEGWDPAPLALEQLSKGDLVAGFTLWGVSAWIGLLPFTVNIEICLEYRSISRPQILELER